MSMDALRSHGLHCGTGVYAPDKGRKVVEVVGEVISTVDAGEEKVMWEDSQFLGPPIWPRGLRQLCGVRRRGLELSERRRIERAVK